MEYLHVCEFCREITLYKEKWLASRKAYPCIHCRDDREKEKSHLLYEKRLLEKGFKLKKIIEGEHSKKHRVIFECISCGVIKEKNLYQVSLPSSKYKCNCNNTKKNKRDLKKEEVLQYANQKTLNKFDIIGKYDNLNAKVIIQCKKCKLQSERWGKELFKKNVIKCNCETRSTGEQLVYDILLKYDFKIQEQFKIQIKGHSLFMDFFLENYNTFIEYQGEQHYIAVEHWGGEDKLLHQQYLDNLKKEYCLDNDFCLIEIPYNLNDAEIEEIIKNIE